MRRADARRAAGKSTNKPLPFARLLKQVARVPRWIRARCRAKVQKRYGGRAGLLIYLNWSDFGARHAEVEQSLLPATRIAKDAFTEVWVLWETQLYQTWRAGKAAKTVKDAPGTHDAYARR